MRPSRSFGWLVVVAPLTLAAGHLQASTLSWEFASRHYADFYATEDPIAHGTLVTRNAVNAAGQYEVLDIDGYYGADAIVGLASRPARSLWDPSSLEPDNAVSVNGWDATNGCSGHTRMWDDSPHFSCAGLSFFTEIGFVNLFWAGAQAFVSDYQGQFFPAHHQIALASPVPEPSTFLLTLLGVGFIRLRFAARRG